jgi:AraC family transcriptional regulator, regulatory protein of adaptative response / methylated-DNA-[protein]-cysteine methyltransferase
MDRDNSQSPNANATRSFQRARAGKAQARRALVERLCRVMDASETAPTIAELSKLVGLSPFHLHRIFKGETGVTPRQYAQGCRAARLRRSLATSDASVTQAIYDSGFNSAAGFYEQADKMLGMPPRTYRSGGDSVEIRFAVAATSLGAVLVAMSPRGVCAITMGNDPNQLTQELQDRFPRAAFIGGDAAFERIVAQVVGFIEAPRTGLDLPLDLQGTLFQQRVWQALLKIPAGATVSYAQIAQLIGAPSSARAVAQACGANRIAVAVPCHRVVRSDGGLSGYRWGVDRKRRLLDREKSSL